MTKRKTYSEFVMFAFVKGVALRAVREQLRVDPSSWVCDTEKRIKAAKSVAELDEFLIDKCEDDWLEGFVIARSAELASNLSEGDVYNV